MSDDVVLIEKEGALAKVTMNRPDSLNAFDASLRAGMRDAVARVEDDQTIRVVILKGAGRGFCSGADLGAGRPDTNSFVIDREYKPFLDAIAQSNKIWIAQVHGPAAGIGAAVAMNCDLMTMAEDAYIYLAFAAIALVPDGGNTRLLFEAMGYKRALETCIEGRKVPAAECHSFGICNKTFAPDVLEAETEAWAQSLAARAPLSLAATKRLMRQVGRMSYGDAISAEAREQEPLLQSSDFVEGVRAFFAKDTPTFQGK